MVTWYRRRKYREKVETTIDALLRAFPGLYKSVHSKRAATKDIEDAFAGNHNPYEVGLGIATAYMTSFLEHGLSAEKRAECLRIWEEHREYGFGIAFNYVIRVAYGLTTSFDVSPLAMDASIREVLDTLRGIPPEQRRSNRIRGYREHTDPENRRRVAEFLRSDEARQFLKS
jgi:hypothetical protein